LGLLGPRHHQLGDLQAELLLGERLVRARSGELRELRQQLGRRAGDPGLVIGREPGEPVEFEEREAGPLIETVQPPLRRLSGVELGAPT
jgi:hypothetical protein